MMLRSVRAFFLLFLIFNYIHENQILWVSFVLEFRHPLALAQFLQKPML